MRSHVYSENFQSVVFCTLIMSAQLHGTANAPFDDDISAHQPHSMDPPNTSASNTSDSMTDDANDVDMNGMNNNDDGEEEEEIDYFGDYNTTTIDTEISSGPLYNPHTVPNGVNATNGTINDDNNNSPSNINGVHHNHFNNKHDNNNNNNSSTNTLDYDAAYNDYINDGKQNKRKRYRPFYDHNRDRYSRSKYNQSHRKRRCMSSFPLFINTKW